VLLVADKYLLIPLSLSLPPSLPPSLSCESISYLVLQFIRSVGDTYSCRHISGADRSVAQKLLNALTFFHTNAVAHIFCASLLE
jgi:hypothetical protein